MTAIEWISLAQEKIRSAAVSDWRFNNVQDIEAAVKCLNEAKVLINEHQTILGFEIGGILTTNG